MHHAPTSATTARSLSAACAARAAAPAA